MNFEPLDVPEKPVRENQSTRLATLDDDHILEAGENTTFLDGKRSIRYSLKEGLIRIYKRPNRRFYAWLMLLLTSILVLGLAPTFRSWNREKVWTDCGGTPEGARSRGCSFDMLSHAWQTKECYDKEISETFRQAGAWEYYLDQDAKFPVSEATVMRGETDVWMREYPHYVHCTYMWRQMHRAFTVLHHIDSHLNSYNHTLHCQGVFLENRDGDLLEVMAKVIYPSCYRV